VELAAEPQAARRKKDKLRFRAERNRSERNEEDLEEEEIELQARDSRKKEKGNPPPLPRSNGG